ncbi:sensor histidine kinase [Natronospora cellulosivora (SeqCode)]
MSRIGMKIFLVVLLMSIAGLLITVFFINYGVGVYFSQYLREELDIRIDQLADRLEENVQDNQIERIPMLIDEFARNQRMVLYMETIDGEVLFSNIDHRGYGRRQDQMMHISDLQPGVKGIDMLTIKDEDGNDFAYLFWELAGQHRHATEQSSLFLSNVNRTLLIVTLFMVLLASFISLFLSRYITLPLIKMNNLATKVAEGDYKQKVEIRKGDEFAELGDSLNKMTARLDYLNRLREESVGDLAHELRTPLAIVSNYLMAIRDGVLKNDESTFQEMELELARLQRLVNRLEDLAEIDKKILNLDKEKIDLKELLDSLVCFYSQEAERKNIDFSTCFIEKDVFIEGDYDSLKTIFMNLLSNAFKYTSSDGKVSLELYLQNNKKLCNSDRIGIRENCILDLDNIEDDGDKVIVKIIDTGIGISKNELPYIFSRFYRTDKSRSSQTGGTGLGLTIVKKLLKAHGGKIYVDSKETVNEGSTVFTLVFDSLSS